MDIFEPVCLHFVKKHQIYNVLSSTFAQDNIVSSSVLVLSVTIFIIFIRPHINKFYLTMVGVVALLLVFSVTCSFVTITVNYKTTLNAYLTIMYTW